MVSVQSRLPHPAKARKAIIIKGHPMTWQQLATAAGCSVSTVARCEASGQYPSIPAVRANYLKALNLKEAEG